MNPVSPKTSDIMRSQIPPGHALKIYFRDTGWHWMLDEIGISSTGIVHVGSYPSFGEAWRDGMKIATLAHFQSLPQVAQSQSANRTMYYIPF